MFATVEWMDHKGRFHSDHIDQPTCVTTVLDMIEAKGGKVSKYNRIPTLDRDTMTPRDTTTLPQVEAAR